MESRLLTLIRSSIEKLILCPLIFLLKREIRSSIDCGVRVVSMGSSTVRDARAKNQKAKNRKKNLIGEIPSRGPSLFAGTVESRALLQPAVFLFLFEELSNTDNSSTGTHAHFHSFELLQYSESYPSFLVFVLGGRMKSRE